MIDPTPACVYNIGMFAGPILAETTLSGPSGVTIFYLTLLFIFLTAIITTVATKWARDKCLKLLGGYPVTLERSRGQLLWGKLNVFSSGIEIVYGHPYIDPNGLRKTSFLIYQQEIDPQVLSMFRYHDNLPEAQRKLRLRQVHRTFNPGFFRRAWRAVRNFINTLRDAFNAAIGAAVSQYQKVNPASAVLATQSGSVVNIGQTLLGKFANAYEPLLEQYIGHPVILEVADPLNPNNVVQEYAGYLAEYTQQFIAVFNVEHAKGEQIVLQLPDVERGEALPPLPPPPPPGAPSPVLPPPLAVADGVEIRIDGNRLKLRSARHEMLAVRRLERDGFEPLELQLVWPPMGMLNLPARDARGGRLICDVLRCADVVAPRRWSSVRHAGEMLERKGLLDELALDRLPLVSRLLAFGEREESEK